MAELTINTTREGCKSPEHRAWTAMLGRCQNTLDQRYKNYGGRGITVCERWESFRNFLMDMGLRPDPTHSLDRINNDGNYEPGNCRWTDQKTQCRNMRRNIRITFNGITLCATDWAARLGFPSHVIIHRINSGWSEEKSLTTPLFPKPPTTVLTLDGISHTFAEWAGIVGIKATTIKMRIWKGWSPRRALTPHNCVKKMLTHNDETLCQTEWAVRLGITPATFCDRLRRGWSVERLLSTPNQQRSS